MSLNDEKQLVAVLRFERGMTLQQIANELSKSVFWVTARLNPAYEPKRGRTTSGDEAIPPAGTDLERFAGQCTQILRVDWSTRHEMDPYSLDLRLRILRACEEEADTREGVAGTFGVSRSFVQKLLRRWDRTGRIAPRPHAGGPLPKLDEAALAELRVLVKTRPDATLAELCGALKDRGSTAVSEATVCRALQTLHLPVKKSLCMRTSGTHRGSGRCGAGGGGRRNRPTRPASFSWTKAGPTPR